MYLYSTHKLRVLMLSDSDYQYESCTEDEDANMGKSHRPLVSPFIDTLTLSDKFEMANTVYEITDEYVQEHILQMAEPEFHTQLADDIVKSIFDQWQDAGLCEECDYDDICDFIETLIDEYFEWESVPPVRSHKTTVILAESDRAKMSAKIEYLLSIPQHVQRTPEWYAFRHGLITASNLSKIFCSVAQQNSLIYEKCRPLEENRGGYGGQVNTRSPMHWGQKYEPVSRMIYEKIYSTKVSDDFGCIRHREIECIGASPDGVVVDPLSDRYGRMVEIKNIVNREMNGVPSKAYWIQMQVQMETCELEECDFFETRICEYSDEDAFWAETAPDPTSTTEYILPEHRGVILYFVDRVSIGGGGNSSNSNSSGDVGGGGDDENLHAIHMIPEQKPHYEYMPLDISLNKKAVYEWIESTRQRLRRNYSLYTTLWWYLADYSCVLVERNHMWFNAAKSKIQETWKTIECERNTGYEHRAAKKRTTNSVYDMVAEGITCHYIRNLPISQSVCLIKLDA